MHGTPAADLTRLIDEGMAERGDRIHEWPQDEAEAYREQRFAVGRAAARTIQVRKTVDSVIAAGYALTAPAADPEVVASVIEEAYYWKRERDDGHVSVGFATPLEVAQALLAAFDIRGKQEEQP